MTDKLNEAAARLAQIRNFITGTKPAGPALPWDPDSNSFPTRRELPRTPGAPEQAAWVWGKDDYLGRLNLLTAARVKEASKEIQTGEKIPVNLPLHLPDPPSFGRETFKHTVKTIHPGVSYDDLYHLNTQSGTQWDGFRHFSHIPTRTFYNFTKAEDITDENGQSTSEKCSMHHWAQHGIAGRGILLDYYSYAQSKGLVYDPYSSYAITYSELVACGKHQGLDIRPIAQGGHIRPGDILFIRSGFNVAYNTKDAEDRQQLAHREGPELKYAGVEQSEEMLDWLHDCYFAAVAGDAPSFEVWPTQKKFYMHEYILALWGMPLGEMLDLERLSEKCRQRKRWSFFFTSSPANVVGGVSSHVNGLAIL